jgi:hypothetical protein
MAIGTNFFNFCEGCPDLEPDMYKLYGDNQVFSSAITCKYHHICARVYDHCKETLGNRKKCSSPKGVEIKPDGIHLLDPCIYEVLGTYKDVRLTVLQCKNCGNIDFEWQYEKDISDEEDDE